MTDRICNYNGLIMSKDKEYDYLHGISGLARAEKK